MKAKKSFFGNVILPCSDSLILYLDVCLYLGHPEDSIHTVHTHVVAQSMGECQESIQELFGEMMNEGISKNNPLRFEHIVQNHI